MFGPTDDARWAMLSIKVPHSTRKHLKFGEPHGVEYYFDHPYWNGASNPARQDMRVTALCLMADIIESPNV
jgi:hypothetical protein